MAQNFEMHVSENIALLAPLSGVVVPIESVPDPVFRDKMVGDGISIDPTSQTVLAPCDATVTLLHAAHHAITLTTSGGVEILIHVGLDTVNLKGKGFKARVTAGDKVAAGEPLIDFDADYVLRKATSLLTQIVVTNGEAVAIVERASGIARAGESLLLTVQLRRPGSQRAGAFAEGSAGPGEEVSAVVVVRNPSGLHARPAAVLVNKARTFSADVRAELGGRSANAKSLVAVLSLGAVARAELRLVARGDDAARAVAELIELIQGGLGEDLAALAAPGPGLSSASHERDDDRHFHGVTAAPGLSMGPAFKLDVLTVEVKERGEDPKTELARLGQALVLIQTELSRLAGRPGMLGEQAEIFSAHLTMLEDPEMSERAEAAIRQGKSAAFAWREAIKRGCGELAALSDPLLASRAVDLADVGARVLRELASGSEPLAAPAGSVVLAERLTPSDVMRLADQRVAGLVTVLGGTTSHVAILSRSLGLPCLVGVSRSALSLSAGATVVLDADSALLLADPDAATLSAYRQQIEARAAAREAHLAMAQERAVTRDGVHIEVLANIANAGEAEKAMQLGAEGVGLVRTEFMFLERDAAPTEAEQIASYEAMANAVGKRILTVRTLDVGGDKPLPYLPLPAEDNPLLGLRGLRVSLLSPELLRGQLRAILSARGESRRRIMLPMVSSLEELREAKRMVDEERQRVSAPDVELGIMVEVPSVAIQADLFAAEVDFFSIGTNDLTQYTLAMDRTHPRLASRQDGLHPAVLRLIDATVRAGRKLGKPVGVCGALASDPGAIAVLIGLGVTDLSVGVQEIPDIKAKIRGLDAARCRAIAEAALALGSASEVRALVAQG
jgi:phosphoenolpyruvate-protein phosphotransferase